MAYNNTVTLIGNLGKEALIHESNGKTYASVSLATVDSYKDKEGNWVNKDTVWHSLMIFSPKIVAAVQSLKKGTRVKVVGSLSYRPFTSQLEDGSDVTKHAVSIIVGKFELVPLFKKS